MVGVGVGVGLGLAAIRAASVALVVAEAVAEPVAVASEEEEILLDGQRGENRTVLELKLKGFSNSEVSRSTGWHIRKIERFLEKLRGTWRL